MYCINEKIKLIPMDISDKEFMYELRNNKEIMYSADLSYVYPKPYLLYEKKFEQIIESNEQLNYIIHFNNVKVGVAQIWSIEFINQKAKLGLIINSTSSNSGIGSLVMEKLVNICFKELNLHKLEVKVLYSNLGMIRLLEKNGFSCEGTLRNSCFKDGQYKDVLMYGLIKTDR